MKNGRVVVKTKIDGVDPTGKAHKKNRIDRMLFQLILKEFGMLRLTGHKEDAGTVFPNGFLDHGLFLDDIIVGTKHSQMVVLRFSLHDDALKKLTVARVFQSGENGADLLGGAALQIASLGIGHVMKVRDGLIDPSPGFGT